ncbi:methylmalonyl-CoA mutase [Hymenobacter daecheongensis DSM 21074]|uniref:Methylmalonyl-CoA mutase n=1 Tax=Hymenobacter daecheongensis DSM 21074 TaxID=1121955 RepID=A0A1M6CF94_9BACT|nr:methylmalonyl-CoA mutase family protein [Hymenobacter daecheongensis]SHI59667.1 methylmalonyl-CoA mutase [Hymenobacter daecheongensis DSM 21074]
MADTLRSAPVSFPEFEPVSTAAWQERIRRDLKGADPETLVWTPADGFPVQPFYHAEALDALSAVPIPQVRAGQPDASWLNVPTYAVASLSNGHAAVGRAADALRRGADGACFELTDAASFDVDYLNSHLPLGTTYLGFSVRLGAAEFVQRLLAAEPAGLRGFLRFDPVSDHTPDLPSQLADLRQVLRLTRHLPDFRALTLNGAFFANRGGTATQQIGFTLATAATYLSELPDDTLSVADVAAALQIQTALNPNYFLEIAKLRALRRLWATLLHAYELPAEAAANLRIFAGTSTWSRTTLDPHTNLLRVTTETMAAVLGGADAVSVAPFDSLYHDPNEFSDRLARNLSIILREESQLGRVADPAAGSYYLETLTDQLARNGWALFQHVQAQGGLPAAVGLLMQELHKVAQQQFQRIADGSQVVVGTNRFQNPHEQFDYNPKKLLRSRDFDSTRATYPSEVLRLATALHFQRREKKHKRAAVVLLGTHTNQLILESFMQLLPKTERKAISASHPEGTLSVLFSTPEGATLMYATPDQFGHFARVVCRVRQDDAGFVPPHLLNADLATMQEAVALFGFQEFTVEGYSTDDVLARLQGR